MKTVPGYPPIYTIDESGNFFRTLKSGVKRQLKPRSGWNDYVFFDVKVDGRYTKASQHRLLMLAYRPIHNPEDMHVDHINGDKRDNRLENLRWLTPGQNVLAGNGVTARNLRKTHCKRGHLLSLLNGETK